MLPLRWAWSWRGQFGAGMEVLQVDTANVDMEKCRFYDRCWLITSILGRARKSSTSVSGFPISAPAELAMTKD